jgi:acyl-CoA thioesterase YciA
MHQKKTTMSTADDSTEDLDSSPRPAGDLTLQIVALPSDTNAHGDLYGGWLVQQMDLAGSVAASRVAQGKVATVAIDAMAFLRPVAVGSVLAFHTRVLNIGRSSIAVMVEVWATAPGGEQPDKITETQFTFVAIDTNRRTRPVPRL